MSLVEKTNCLNLTIKALAQKIFEILIFEVTYIYLSTHFFIFLTEINLKQRNLLLCVSLCQRPNQKWEHLLSLITHYSLPIVSQKTVENQAGKNEKNPQNLKDNYNKSEALQIISTYLTRLCWRRSEKYFIYILAFQEISEKNTM